MTPKENVKEIKNCIGERQSRVKIFRPVTYGLLKYRVDVCLMIPGLSHVNTLSFCIKT